MNQVLPKIFEAPSQTPLSPWLAAEEAQWTSALDELGAVLFRGFEGGQPEFESLAERFYSRPLRYVYRSTPRTEIGRNVYTATEYPPPLTIPQHSENAYQRDWPLRLSFYCDVAPGSGGETPLSDNRLTTAKIPAAVRERFREKGVMYVRNYGQGVDLPWPVVFQTEDRAEVERFCQENAIEWEWLGGDRLRTRQICHALARHPKTGEEFWFNHAHLFHVSSLDPKTQQAMLAIFKRDELPRNAYYGDGSEIEPEVLASIREAFESTATTFPWQKGDVLLVDNMRVAHGRRPFSGPRRVLVSMGDPYSALQGG